MYLFICSLWRLLLPNAGLRPLLAPWMKVPAAITCTLVSSGCIYSTPEWSPSGEQLAFLAQEGDEEEILPDDWLLGPYTSLLTPAKPRQTERQLWVGRVSDNRLSLIERTTGWMSVPVWAPDGQSIAFVRFTPDDSGDESLRGRLELVRRHRDGKSETLFQQTGDFPRPLVEALAFRPGAWSSDGRFLASPWIGSRSLFVWNVVDRRTEAEWPTADLPSWSPDSRWLAFYDRGRQPGYRVIQQSNWSDNPKVVDVASAVQPVVWDPGSEAFFLAKPPFVLTEPTGERNDFGIGRAKQVRFIVERVTVPGLERQSAFTVARPSQKVRQFSACYFDFNWTKETALASVLADGVASRVDVVRLYDGGESRPWHPLEGKEVDSLLPLGAIRCSPNGRHVALRFGVADWSAPLVVCEPAEHRIDVWAPTTAVRMRAIWTIIHSLSRQVRAIPPGTPMSFGIGREPTDDGPYLAMAYPKAHPLDLLRIPTEFATRSERHESARAGDHRTTIDDLARLGVDLIAGVDPEGLSARLQRQLAEARLFFEYSRENYVAALDAINAVERIASKQLSEPQRRWLWVARIQSLAGSHRYDAARWEFSRRSTTITGGPATAASNPPPDAKLLERLRELDDLLTSDAAK